MKIENKDFRREDLEALSSQRLDDLLQAEMKKDSKNTKAILQILSILEKREAGDPANDVDVSDAWAEFEESCANARDEVKLLDISARKGRKPRRWVSTVVAAAVVAVVLVLFTPRAEGAENLFDRIGRWTQSVFEFFDSFGSADPGEEYVFKTDDPNLQQIYDAVAAQGVTKPVVPTWLPEGYEMTELKVTKTSLSQKIYARLINGESFITVTVEIYDQERSNKYAKDEPNANVYEYKGVKHYIVLNEEKLVAAWSVDNLECVLMMDCQEEVLYEVLRSIYCT